MVSEGVQTNGITSRHSSQSDQSSQISPPPQKLAKPPPTAAGSAAASTSVSGIRPPAQQQPPLPPYTDPPAPPMKTTISPRLASQLPGTYVIIRSKCTMLQKLSKYEVKAAWYGDFSNLLPFRYCVKSNFDVINRSKNTIFANFTGPEL